MSRIKVNKAEPFTKGREVSVEGLRCLDTTSNRNGVIKYKGKQFLFRDDNKWKTLGGTGTAPEYKIEYTHKHHISPEFMQYMSLLNPSGPITQPKVIMPTLLPFPPHLGGGTQMAISSMLTNAYTPSLITHPLPRGPGMELIKIYCTYWCGPSIPLDAAECTISYSNINDKPVFDPAFVALGPGGGPGAPPPPAWYDRFINISSRISHSANPPAVLYDNPPPGLGAGDLAIPAFNNLVPDSTHSSASQRAAAGLHTVEYTLVDPLPLYGDTVSSFNMWLTSSGVVNQSWAYYGTTLVTKTTLDVVPK